MKPEETASSPAWMLTMGDMNTLLLATELPEIRLRIRADGFSWWIEPSADWENARVRNQRVEIVLTNESVRER